MTALLEPGPWVALLSSIDINHQAERRATTLHCFSLPKAISIPTAEMPDKRFHWSARHGETSVVSQAAQRINRAGAIEK
jgi:hypothetical protein